MATNIKIRGRNSILRLELTVVFEHCVVRCGSKNGYQKDVSLKDVGLAAQNLLTILSSIVKIDWGRAI